MPLRRFSDVVPAVEAEAEKLTDARLARSEGVDDVLDDPFRDDRTFAHVLRVAQGELHLRNDDRRFAKRAVQCELPVVFLEPQQSVSQFVYFRWECHAMPRLMSFSASVDAIRSRAKTVTRRLGWGFWAIETLALRPGGRVNRLALLRCVSVRRERLCDITLADVAAEGFADWTRIDFIRFFRDAYGATPATKLTRIEFAYEDDSPLFTFS